MKENSKYTIVTKNDTAGYLEVSKWQEMDTVFYSYYSNATTTLLKTFHVVSERICKYANGQLVFSHSENIVNGNVRDAATTIWKGSHYEIQNGNSSSIENEIIDFSSVLLFFLEPKNIQETFSELKTSFIAFSKPEEHAYKLNTGWGKHSTYFYEQGLLKKAEIVTPLISFELLRN
ncbi:MAG: DUF6134 family protein [Chitinophagales bacterium]